MIRPTPTYTPCNALAGGCQQLAPRSGMGAVTLPIVGTVPTWLLIAAAAAAVYWFVIRKQPARRTRAKRIIRRVTEF